jgi:F-type H+-transporting ATPase subunit b
MEILTQFGVDKYLLAAQIINFLVIAYILKRFAYKPILKLLEDRKKTIAQGLSQADEARILLEQANEKESTLLKNAQAAARKMQDEAKKHAEEIMRKTEEDTKKRAEQMLLEAKEKIELEARTVEKRLEAHTTELAVAFLEKAVSSLFTPADQKAVLSRAVKELKGAKK